MTSELLSKNKAMQLPACYTVLWSIILSLNYIPSLARQQETASLPNVLIIISDDMNDWIEPYGGYDQTKTPNLQRLASQGITYSQAWPTVSWCNPSRVSIITGIHPLRSGVISNDQFPFRDYIPNARTIMDYFNDKGYYTLGLGKVLHKPSDDLEESWDDFHPYTVMPKPQQLPLHGISEIIDLKNEKYDWGPINASMDEWGDYQATDHAINTINKQDQNSPPFFICMGYRLPHLPFYYPEEFDDHLDSKVMDLPNDSLPLTIKEQLAFELMRDNHVWNSAIRSYLASINFVDFNIGRLLDALEKNQPVYDNTIIIFISDHGYHIGEKGRWGKVTLWNEALRTPFIIKVPGLEDRAGEVDNTPVNLYDIYPTLQELAHLEPNKFIDGNNLFANNIEKRNTNFSIIPGRRFAYQNADLKYIQMEEEEFLFNIKSDFRELDFNYKSKEGNDIVLSELRVQAEDQYTNRYQSYEHPQSPSNVKINIKDKKVILNWEQDSSRNFSYHIAIRSYDKSVDDKNIYTDKDSLVLDSLLENAHVVRIKTYNPKYSSQWTRLYLDKELAKFPLSDLLQLDLEFTAHSMTGERITKFRQNSSDLFAPNQFKSGMYIFHFGLDGINFTKKVFMQ